MKRKYTRVTSALLAVLMISTQPAVMTWADSMVPADHLLGGDEYIGKKTGYATPADAEQKDEDSLEPDAAPEQEKIPPSRIELADEKQLENKNPDKTVIQWEFVDDDNLSGGELSLIGVSPENRADFDTVVSMLPNMVRVKVWAEMDGAAPVSWDILSDDSEDIPDQMSGERYEETLSILDWNCPEYRQDEEGEWPFAGEYEFNAELPEGYVCELPISVMVILGGAGTFLINDRFTADGMRYKEVGPDAVQLLGYDGEKPSGTLVIPDVVQDPANGREYQVVHIGKDAFRDCSGLTGDLVIPDTVTSILDGAFMGCNFTGELTLSGSLTDIGNDTFRGNGFTGELVLPQTLVFIGDRVFEETGFSGQLNLPEKLDHMGANAFAGCGFTGELTLPEGLTELKQEVFKNCGFTGPLVLPDGLARIYDGAFYGCSGFTGRLSIPDGVTIIGKDAFFGTTGIEGYDTTRMSVANLLNVSGVDEKMIMVGDLQFYSNNNSFFSFDRVFEFDNATRGTGLKLIVYHGDAGADVSIPDVVMDPFGINRRVTHIDSDVFANKNIKGSLTLPDTLEYIGPGAFSGNQFTGDLTIPGNVTYIGRGAFEDAGFADGSLTINSKLTRIEDNVFANCGFTGSLDLPDELSHIGAGSFRNCGGFTGRLSVPEAVTEIGTLAFYGCDGFTEAVIGANLNRLGRQAFPESLPLSTSSYRVQMLLNTYLNQDVIVPIDWSGNDVPDGAIASSSSYMKINGDCRIGREAVLTIMNPGELNMEGALLVDGNLIIDGSLILKGSLIVNGNLTVNGGIGVDGTIYVEGTLTISEYLAGFGTIFVGKNGNVEGNTSSFRVQPVTWSEDLKDAKNMIEAHTYTAGQESAGDEAAVKDWLTETIAAIPGFSDTEVTVGDVTITSFTPAIEGTSDHPNGVDGSFAFTLRLSREIYDDSAGGFGRIAAKRYSQMPGQQDLKDVERARSMIESHAYTIEQEDAGNEAAVKGWLLKTITAIPGFGDTGVTMGEVTIADFTPAKEGTSDRPDGVDGSFVFALMLSKGSSEGGAGGGGTITAKGYNPIPGRLPSGKSGGGTVVNPDILRGTWERTETGVWKFRQTSGAYAASRWGMIDSLWYYFDGEGRMLTGWQYINDQWYYLCTEEDTKTKAGLKEGAMATGWHFDPGYQAWFYLDPDGAMAVGWKEIDGKRYYFNPESDGSKGKMAVSTTIDGYQIDMNGVWVQE